MNSAASSTINIPKESMNTSWLFRMAWRDSRRSRSRLLLFTSAIVLGIAALVGITSFGDNMARSVNEQARELVGADLVLSSSQPLDSTLRPALMKIGQQRTEEVAFASLIQFPKGQGVRLAQVRALTGNFPYYGAWETQPAGAVAAFRAADDGRGSPTQRVALVDDALLTQFNAQTGDSIKVGRLTFLIAGRVLKTPGQSGISSAVAPTVFIPGTLLSQTGLAQRGSRLNYKTYFKFAPGYAGQKALTPLKARLDAAGVDTDTVAERQEKTGRSFQDLTRFLNLVAFVALLLGCVGVASAVSLYAREKRAAVAVLRCLGASGRQAMLIYLIQTTIMGFAGALLGAALGSLVQLALPRLFAGLLPVAVTVAISWPAIALGVGAGVLVAVLFALLPLLSIRRISPLRTLRSTFDDDTAARDPWRWLVLALIAVFITGFAWLQTQEWKQALGFSGGLLLAFGGLTLGALALMWLVRRLLPVSWSYVWRQGLANLYRPQNQTLVLTVSLGLGTFLIATLYLLQALLLGRVQFSASGQQPNLVLFDIQREQQAGVTALLTTRKLPLLQQVPVVTMRLAAINGRTVSELKKDTVNGAPAWALTREYRVTYRDSLIASEKLVAGVAPFMRPGELPRVSVDADYFKRVKLQLGDTLTFNVQGAPMQTVVGGTRTVDWGRVQTNFLVVFPRGILEQAPQFHVIMTRTSTPAQLAEIQRALVSQFPNVSAIDLGLILKTLDDILSKISFVIRFMALFSIITGLLVLSSLVILSRYQRIQESVLLRTLGASRNQILRITLVEYSLLGLLASAVGIGLAVLATWALAAYVFEATFAPVAAPLLGLAAVVTALTAALGLFNSREVLTRPPLAVLRGDG
jgi:putative ABC transport system permease protein